VGMLHRISLLSSCDLSRPFVGFLCVTRVQCGAYSCYDDGGGFSDPMKAGPPRHAPTHTITHMTAHKHTDTHTQ